MASSLAPKIQTFRAGGTILKGHAVKYGSSNDYVVECTAASDDSIGLAQNAASSGEMVEVARPGGGGKGAAQTSISAGERLTSHTDGLLKPASSGEKICAVAADSAVAGDIFDCDIALGIY